MNVLTASRDTNLSNPSYICVCEYTVYIYICIFQFGVCYNKHATAAK